MEILGYGEDALTLWCLTHRLDAVLRPFGDDPSMALVAYYRPSFGRRSAGSAAVPDIRGPQFGEFDGIILTARGVYLLEAKWTNSGELDDEVVRLRPEQIRRHRIFREYLKEWRTQRPADWSSFVAHRPFIELQSSDGVKESFRTAPSGSLLARNLGTVLMRCLQAGAEVEDVLLIAHPRAEAVASKREGPENFTVVEVQCPAVKDGYVVLGAA